MSEKYNNRKTNNDYLTTFNEFAKTNIYATLTPEQIPQTYTVDPRPIVDEWFLQKWGKNAEYIVKMFGGKKDRRVIGELSVFGTVLREVGLDYDDARRVTAQAALNHIISHQLYSSTGYPLLMEYISNMYNDQEDDNHIQHNSNNNNDNNHITSTATTNYESNNDSDDSNDAPVTPRISIRRPFIPTAAPTAVPIDRPSSIYINSHVNPYDKNATIASMRPSNSPSNRNSVEERIRRNIKRPAPTSTSTPAALDEMTTKIEAAAGVVSSESSHVISNTVMPANLTPMVSAMEGGTTAGFEDASQAPTTTQQDIPAARANTVQEFPLKHEVGLNKYGMMTRVRILPARPQQRVQIAAGNYGGTSTTERSDIYDNHNNNHNISSYSNNDDDNDNRDYDSSDSSSSNNSSNESSSQYNNPYGEIAQQQNVRTIVSEWSARVKGRPGVYTDADKPRPGLPYAMKIFTSQLQIRDLPVFIGKGSSSKRASVNAAEMAYRYIVDHNLLNEPTRREIRKAEIEKWKQQPINEW